MWERGMALLAWKLGSRCTVVGEVVVLGSCDALKIKPCTVIIHAGYTTEIKDSR